MALTFSQMSGTAVLAAPWGIVTSGGTLVKAHGTQTGADTNSYTVSFAPFVPGSGSVTAYLAASIVQIQQDSFPLTGPPQGHPSFNPNFVPANAYATNTYSVSLAAVTGGIDNKTVFELARVTLVPGQTGIASYSSAGWVRAAERNAWPATVLNSGGVLTLAQAETMILPGAASLTHTLPSAGGGGGLEFGFVNPGTGAWTIAASGTDAIAGLVSGTPVTSVGIPPYGAMTAWGNAVSGLWEVTAVNPLMMASLANYWTAVQTMSDPVNSTPLVLIATGTASQSVGVNIKFQGNPGLTPNKYMRVYNGVLGVVNSNYSQVIMTLDDVGNLSASSNIGGGALNITGSGLVASGLTSGNTNNLTPGQGGLIAAGYDIGGMNLRVISSGYGGGWRNDGTNFYLLLTPSGNPFGSFSSYRPMTINFVSGTIQFDNTGQGVTFGGVVQATNFTGSFLGVGGVTFPGNGVIDCGPINSTGLVQGAQVQSFNGNVTANNGRLRAAFGAYNSGDPNSGVILNDFTTSFGTNGYQICPDGTIRQWGLALVTGSTVSIPLNFTFPHTFLNIQATDSNSSCLSYGSAQNGLGAFFLYSTTAGAHACFWEAIGN